MLISVPDLPLELICKIMEYLTVRDLETLSLVHPLFVNLCEDPALWRQRVRLSNPELRKIKRKSKRWKNWRFWYKECKRLENRAQPGNYKYYIEIQFLLQYNFSLNQEYYIDYTLQLPLKCAILHNDYQLTKKLLQKGAKPNKIPVLQYAIEVGNLKLVKLLFNYNIDPNQFEMRKLTGKSKTPFDYAVRLAGVDSACVHVTREERYEIIEYLIEQDQVKCEPKEKPKKKLNRFNATSWRKKKRCKIRF